MSVGAGEGVRLYCTPNELLSWTLGYVFQGEEDLFKTDPFKSDLPASGEANGTASGIANGKSLKAK